jgi:hypothetical protein
MKLPVGKSLTGFDSTNPRPPPLHSSKAWQTLFQNLQTFGAKCMTMSQATEYIQQNGTLVPDGTNKNWVSSVPLKPNLANTATSPTQGAHGLQ